METKKDILEFIRPREREVIDTDYFSSLAANAILLAEKQKSKTKRKIIRRSLFWISSAAAIIFVIIRLDSSIEPVKCDFNSISKTELYSYIDKNIDEFDENLIAHYLKNDYIDTTKKINTSSPIEINSNQPSEIEHDKNDLDLFENVNKEDILKYLETEGITIEELEESVKG